MSIVYFPVYSVAEEHIGRIEATTSGKVDTLFDKAVACASKRFRVDPSSVHARGLRLNNGHFLSQGEAASSVPVKQLAEKEAVVHVELPEAEQFTRSSRTAALEEELENLKTKLESVFGAQQRQRKLGLRLVLDGARAELAGHELSNEERGKPWNDKLDTMKDFKTLSKEAAKLTKFGHGTQQRDSSKAAHEFPLYSIAEAVTSVTNKYRNLYAELFKFVYGMDAGELVFPAVNDDDDDDDDDDVQQDD